MKPINQMNANQAIHTTSEPATKRGVLYASRLTFDARKMKGITSICMLMLLASCNRPHERVSARTVTMDHVEYAISLFQTDHARLPATLRELLPATNGVMGGAASGYLMPKGVIDPWGTPLRYTMGTNGYELRSAGQDATFDTKDDIVRTKR